MIRFILNEEEVAVDLPSGELLLDYIRYHKNLKGTKIGCREGDCGACTVLMGEIKNDQMEYRSVTSCLMALGNAHGKHIVTVEGVNFSDKLNLVQQAMSEEGATQCGFCTPGFVVSLSGFCLNDSAHSYEAAIDAVNGNICRCTGYKSIERAAERVSASMKEKVGKDVLTFVTKNEMMPAYFTGIVDRLKSLKISIGLIENKATSTTRILGGGTDLYVQQHEAMVNTSLNFFADKKEYKKITKKGDHCVMGASATVSDILESPIFTEHFPDIFKFIKLVSSTQIRNMATVAGNFVNASPIGDLTIFFLALDAQLMLFNGESCRQLPLREFYLGYKQLNKKPEEYITGFSFKLPSKNDYFNFEKVSKRTHLDIASVNSAFYMVTEQGVITEAAVSAGGVGPVPMFLRRTSDFLKGKKISEEIITAAIQTAQTEISPISDARGSETYKRLLLSQLMKAHFFKLEPALIS